LKFNYKLLIKKHNELNVLQKLYFLSVRNYVLKNICHLTGNKKYNNLNCIETFLYVKKGRMPLSLTGVLYKAELRCKHVFASCRYVAGLLIVTIGTRKWNQQMGVAHVFE
jgi:hypothetical protein